MKYQKENLQGLKDKECFKELTEDLTRELLLIKNGDYIISDREKEEIKILRGKIECDLKDLGIPKHIKWYKDLEKLIIKTIRDVSITKCIENKSAWVNKIKRGMRGLKIADYMRNYESLEEAITLLVEKYYKEKNA